jgi:hypothetical protein
LAGSTDPQLVDEQSPEGVELVVADPRVQEILQKANHAALEYLQEPASGLGKAPAVARPGRTRRGPQIKMALTARRPGAV